MAFKQLTIETWGDSPASQITARVKRQADRKFFDMSDLTFKGEADCKNPWVQFQPSDSLNSPTSCQAYLDIDPKQWADGDYTIYFHDASILYSIAEVTVFDGDSTTRKSPSSTDIAGRVMDATVASHKIPGTVGAWMLDVTARLQAIQQGTAK